MNKKIGIIRYPGSNCDIDTSIYFGSESFYIWHTYQDISILDNLKLIVIPGGFAFGDRKYEKATGNYKLDPGIMALDSPVSKIIFAASKRKIPIIGICNGFQILTKMGLLPGELLENNSGKFCSRYVGCTIKSGNISRHLSLPIANRFGRYIISESEYTKLEKNEQIFLYYTDYENGSYKNIAGVCDETKTVFGLMPHPERNLNKSESRDADYFRDFLDENIFNKKGNREIFHKKVNDLFKSEHISYKSTRKYLKNLYTKNKHIVQGPGENAGIIDLGEGYCLVLRIESHNHPIFIDPYNGAATGVGGILRDIFTMGARPIAIMDFLRFGDDAYNDDLIPETIRGISDYSNCFGVANVGGDFYRGEIYNKNPLLNVAAFGIVKKENIIYGNALNEGSVLIYVGAKTGNEGINGALMSSKQFNNKTDMESLKKNIQVGDPFLEKLLQEACNEIAELQLAEGMQDMGAGGVLCSTIEVIKRGQDKTGKTLGCDIYIDRIPEKYRMDPCDKLISESQERMLIVSSKDNVSQISKIFRKWDLEYSVIGSVTETSNYTVYDRENGDIIYEQPIASFESHSQNWDLKDYPYDKANTETIKIKDTELWEIYDKSIGNRTIKGPNESGHYSILDIYEIGKKLVITWGESFDTCHTKMLELNGQPLGLINCMNFGHPEESMGEFVRILEDFNRKCKDFDIPIVGGNVSLYNATENISIKPTPILVMVGIIE